MKKLRLILALCALLLGVSNASAQDWTAGAAVATGDYYLYNVGADRYLNRGHAYKYRSLVDGTGAKLTLAKDGDNYRIQFEGVSNAYFGQDLYADKATSNGNYSTWIFESATVDGLTNAYVVKCAKNSKYLIWNGSNGNSDTDWSDSTPTNNNGYWLLIPDATRKNYSGANVSSPVNMTYLITNADFEQNIKQATSNTADLNGWTGNAKFNANNTGAGFGTFWEQWTNGANDGHLGDVTLKQTISNLPSGAYRLTASALAAAQGKDNKADVTGVSVYAGDKSANVATGESGQPFTINDIIVTNGSLEIGYKTKSTSANWIAFDNVRLYYVDPYVSVLATEAFTSGNTMTAGQWYTFTVPTDGDYTLSATDGILYSAEDCLLSAASSATSTVALKAGTAYFKSATSQALTITYVEPVVANGDYYLYDATNKVFLSRGANYGTRAVVDKYGIPFTWNNYSKTITFKDWSDTYMFFDQNDHSACWLYTDGGSNRGDNRLFAFEATTGGYYLRDLAKAVYVINDGTVLPAPTTNSAEATIWTIKTKAEHDAIVAAYATENKENVITSAGISTTAAEFEAYLSENLAAKDKTSEVGTAKFAGSAGDWTYTQVEDRGGATNYGTDWAEMYQRTGNWSQEITGLSQGIYKVTVNAFERITGYATCNTLGAEGYEIVTAYFKANDEQAQLASWYSDKEDENNPNNTTQAATAFNNDKYKIELYTYVGSDGKLTLTLNKPSYNGGTWVLFNNVTLTYYDSNVSDEEATAILTEATTTMSSPMKASLYQALATAKTTFDGARTVPNYNALRTAIDNTSTSISSYAAMNTNYLQPITEYLAANNFIDQTSAAYTAYAGYKDAYDNYTDAETADVENATANALNWKSGERYVTPINNIMMANWKIGNTNALTNNSGFYMNTWSNESAGTGDAADFANPFYEYWVSGGSLAATTLTGTLTGLTANTTYDVTATVRVQGSSKVAGSITMEVVGGVPVDVTAGDQIGETTRYIKSYTATGVTDGDGNLVLKFNVAANSNISWLSFRDVTYAANGSVTPSNDFTALNTAISSYDNNIGFENGEYAPYTNIAGLEALAAAKAFDQDRYYTPAAITAATTALTGATWTANVGEKNAIYWDYSALEETDDRIEAKGWYDPAVQGQGAYYCTRIVNNKTKNTGLTAVDGGYALFTKQHSHYGDVDGYTLPLKASRTYKLTFKYAGWGNEPSTTSIYLTDDEGNNRLDISGTFVVSSEDAKNGNSHPEAWVEYTGYFAVPATGNYVLYLNRNDYTGSNQRQVVMGSIDLRTAEYLEFVDGSAVPTYAPGTYPSVKITRTLTANRWATAVYPFAISDEDVDNIAVLDSYDSETGELGFTSAAASTANVPFLMMSESGATEISLSNVVVAATAGNPVATKSEASLKGAYSATDITNAEKNYVMSANKIYSVGAAGATINPYRAYIQLSESSPARALSFVVNGQITSVDNVEAASETEVKDGKYVENGKIVIVKAGKKFNANGQQMK